MAKKPVRKATPKSSTKARAAKAKAAKPKAKTKAPKAKGRKRRTPKPRRPDPAAIFAKLDEIEAEMKRIGFWRPASNKPEPGNFASIPFELWLQFVFLPAAREATRKQQWPDKSQVGLMALRNYDYFDFVEEALPLVQLLNQFDDLIEHPKRAALSARHPRRAPA